MAQYMLSVWHDNEYELDFSSDDAKRVVAQVERFNGDLIAAGAFVFGAGLHPASKAQVMQLQSGDVATTDGPYAESKEHIGGFWIVGAQDINAAEGWARRAAAACERPVELRPLHEE